MTNNDPQPIDPQPLDPQPSEGGTEPLHPSPGKGSSTFLRLAIVVGTPLLVLAILSLQPRRVDLLVYNGNPETVTIVVDGKDRGDPLGPHETLKIQRLVAGEHTLAYRTGETLSESQTVALSADFAAAPRPSYVWDVGGAAGRFWIVHKGYGTSTAPRSRLLTMEAEVAAIPSTVLPLLDDAFPNEIRETKGATGGVRAALWSDHHADSVEQRYGVVCFDNRSQGTLVVQVDGRHVTTVPPRRVHLARLKTGSHLLEARELGAGDTLISEHRLEVDLDVAPLSPTQAWVWCPIEPHDYLILSRTFGEWAQDLPKAEQFQAPAPFFEVPEELLPIVNAFPPSLNLPKGEAGALRRALWTPAAADDPSLAGNSGVMEELLRQVLETSPEGFELPGAPAVAAPPDAAPAASHGPGDGHDH